MHKHSTLKNFQLQHLHAFKISLTTLLCFRILEPPHTSFLLNFVFTGKFPSSFSLNVPTMKLHMQWERQKTEDKILYKVEFFFCKRSIPVFFFFSSQSSCLSQHVFAFSMPCPAFQLLIWDHAWPSFALFHQHDPYQLMTSTMLHIVIPGKPHQIQPHLL